MDPSFTHINLFNYRSFFLSNDNNNYVENHETLEMKRILYSLKHKCRKKISSVMHSSVSFFFHKLKIHDASALPSPPRLVAPSPVLQTAPALRRLIQFPKCANFIWIEAVSNLNVKLPLSLCYRWLHLGLPSYTNSDSVTKTCPSYSRTPPPVAYTAPTNSPSPPLMGIKSLVYPYN